MWDGTSWHNYTSTTGLPSDETFGLTVDKDNNIWVATKEGVAEYSAKGEQRWNTIYSAAVDGQLPYNNTHAIAFDGIDNIWIGHISNGVSQFSKAEGRWIHYTAQAGGLSGNSIRGIAVQDQPTQRGTQGVWFATADGGVSKFSAGRWTAYHIADGLPSEVVQAVAVDHYQRIWAATMGGVVYFDGTRWIPYDSLPTFSLALGVDCQMCPFERNDHVWTGTSVGLTHSRLPYPDKASIVTEICFSSSQLARTCPQVPPVGTVNNTSVLTVTYPGILTPGATFQPEISIAPNLPYTLTVGDQLVTTDDPIVFGTFEHIAVQGTIQPGQPFKFIDYNKPFIAPALEANEQEHTFVSTWRLWMHGRYTGPYIRVAATVRRSAPTPSPTNTQSSGFPGDQE
jgi:ligand-binding sensor domain-containing protein